MLILITYCGKCRKSINVRQYGNLGSSILHKIKYIKDSKLCKRCNAYTRTKDAEYISPFQGLPITKPHPLKSKSKMSGDKKRIGLRGRSAIIARALSAAEYQKELKSTRKR